MAPGDSPTIARRRVRLALREAREARGLTQSDVAEAMEWSLSKVIRIESGEVSISPNDLRPLFALLGIERSRLDALVADAKASRTRQRAQWWQDGIFREHLTSATRRLIEYEREAVAVRFFSIFLVPGPLQTRDFAEAVLNKWQLGLSPEDVAIRLEARMRRRQSLLDRERPMHISALLDESLVRRPIGGPAVLAGQLTDLMAAIEKGRINLRIVPFSVDAPLPSYGAYDIYYLSEDGDDENAVIYRELEFNDEIVEDKLKAHEHRTRFDELWDASMDEDATIDLVQKRLSEVGVKNHK